MASGVPPCPRLSFRCAFACFALGGRELSALKLSNYGRLELEGLPDVWTDLDPYPSFSGCAHGTHQFQSASQRMPHAPEAAAFLPHMQSHGRAFGSREGLRIRRRPVR